MSSPPPFAVTDLNAARQVARRVRATHLYGVVDGMTTIWDFLEVASRAEGVALRKVALSRLLESQAGWGKARVHRVLEQLSVLCGKNVPGQSFMTVGWLLDTRAGGRRYRALVDAISRVDETGRPVNATTPWNGFPYGRVPATVRAGGAHE